MVSWELFLEQLWPTSSQDDCKMAIPAATCGGASIIALCQRRRKKYGGNTTFRAARPSDAPYKAVPMPAKDASREYDELCIVANFVEVFLAREGHDNAVGMNYLEKIQIPHLSSIFGAMLAGVDYVIMGAGIPLKIPGILDRFVNFEPATYTLQAAGSQDGADTTMTFVPREFLERELPPLLRPKFLAIVASNTLAVTMLKKANGKVDGLVIEGPTAGGHNAPPRGKLQLSETGEPIYGERDQVDLDALRALGVPSGSPGDMARLKKCAKLWPLGPQECR